MNSERNESPAPDPGSVDRVLDPRTEAATLRMAPADVAWRVDRLIAAWRSLQKQRRALHAAWTSWTHLRLAPGEEP
jgi:hypothetical protein